MKLGNDTVTVVTITEDTDDRDRYNAPALVRTETAVRGCHVRPMPSREVTSDGATTASEGFKVSAPPVPAVVAVEPGDEILFRGEVFAVVGGVRPHTDFANRASHITIFIERQLG